MAFLVILGWILIIFGIADFGLFYLADIDLTGVSWSPYVAGLLGGWLVKAGGGEDSEKEQE